MAGQADLFRAALHSFVAAQAVAEHPSLEDLLAYCDGTLPEAAIGGLQDHLCLCAECCEVLLDRAKFSSAALPLDEDAKERAWEQLLAAWSGPPDLQPRLPLDLRRFRLAYLLAATLSCAVLGLSLWGVSLRDQLRAFKTPTANLAIVDLLPEGEVTRGSSEPAVVHKTEASDQLVLIFTSFSSFSLYRIVLVDNEGRPLWSIDGKRNENGDVVIAMPHSLLPTGRARFKLYRRDGPHAELVSDYGVWVE
jgi:hypothetical protein